MGPTYFGPYRSASYAGKTANVPPRTEMDATVDAQNIPRYTGAIAPVGSIATWLMQYGNDANNGTEPIVNM